MGDSDKCHETIAENELGLVCDTCGDWFHIKCLVPYKKTTHDGIKKIEAFPWSYKVCDAPLMTIVSKISENRKNKGTTREKLQET